VDGHVGESEETRFCPGSRARYGASAGPLRVRPSAVHLCLTLWPWSSPPGPASAATRAASCPSSRRNSGTRPCSNSSTTGLCSPPSRPLVGHEGSRLLDGHVGEEERLALRVNDYLHWHNCNDLNFSARTHHSWTTPSFASSIPFLSSLSHPSSLEQEMAPALWADRCR